MGSQGSPGQARPGKQRRRRRRRRFALRASSERFLLPLCSGTLGSAVEPLPPRCEGEKRSEQQHSLQRPEAARATSHQDGDGGGWMMSITISVLRSRSGHLTVTDCLPISSPNQPTAARKGKTYRKPTVDPFYRLTPSPSPSRRNRNHLDSTRETNPLGVGAWAGKQLLFHHFAIKPLLGY